jgi:hypothetical protein
MLADLRSELVDAIGAVSGLNVYPHPVDNVVSPAAMVAGLTTTLDGVWTASAEVYVVVSRRHADQLYVLDDLVDPTNPRSVSAAIEGSSSGRCVITSVGEYREFPVGSVPHYAATIQVEVLDG